MTVNDITIGMNQGKTSRSPITYGSMAGQPAVNFRLSISDQKQHKVQSIQRMFEGWNWTRGLKSGFSRLRFSNNPLAEENVRAIPELKRLLDARFVDLEIAEDEINTIPPRTVSNEIDFYSIFVPLDGDFDDEVFQHYVDQSRNYGNCEFIFKVKKESEEEKIRRFSTDWGIYDSHIWLYPKSRAIHTTPEKLDTCRKLALRNNWNVSPRLELLLEADEDTFSND